MAESYIAITGHVPSIDCWEKDMLSVRVPHKWGKKKKEKGLVRLGVCPVRIYKLVHPEDQEEDVMACAGVGSDGSYVLKKHRALRWIQKVMRKALGLRKSIIPSEEKVKKYFFMQPNQIDKGVAVVALGMKKDEYNEDGIEQL